MIICTIIQKLGLNVCLYGQQQTKKKTYTNFHGLNN